MTTRNEDFLFAQEAQALGYVTEAQVEEGLLLQKRMSEELRLDERLAVILVKRGWLAEDQARRVTARIEPGGGSDEIAGYRLVEKIGKGAMGTVYKAVHLGLHRVVAIKVLRKDLATDPTQIERLKAEAKLLASLDHPNIVRALDAGEANGFPFVAMEYVEGESLRDRIAREGPLPEDDALRIARGLADALEKARRMGVVHRDVKPGNVLLTKAGDPKLMDLGLAKGPVDLGLTQHGATVGTPQYISPEQAQDPKKADTRSDIYSLGATLYAMLVGRPPFEGSTLAEIITKVLYETPTPPRALNPDVSPETGYLIERMMLKDPSLRYHTPAEVVRDIDLIRGGRSIIPTGFAGNWEGYLLRRRAKRWGVALATSAVAGVLLALPVGLYVENDRTERRTASAERRIEDVLVSSQPRPEDDEGTLERRLADVRAVEASLGELRPPSWERLQRREADLARYVADYVTWNPVEQRVVEHARAGAYDVADKLIVDFMRKVPGVRESPAEVAALRLQGTVHEQAHSALAQLRHKASASTATTWEEYVREQRDTRRRLETGWPDLQAVAVARTAQFAVVKALDGIQKSVGELAKRFAEDEILRRLEAYELAGLSDDLKQRQDQIRREAKSSWSNLESSGVSFEGARERLETRLGAIEIELQRLLRDVWHATLRRAEDDARSRDLERVQAAIDRIDRAKVAFRAGGFAQLENEAWSASERLSQQWKGQLARADAAYDTVLKAVLANLRAGLDPTEVGRPIRAALDADENWPRKKDLSELLVVPNALDALYRDALDQLDLDRGTEKLLRMREGGERKWRIVDVQRGGGQRAVTLAPVAGAKAGPPELHPLSDLAVAQITTLAHGSGRTLRPIEEAVAILAEMPEQRDGGDLRPLLGRYRRIVTELQRAKEEGALTTWVRDQHRERFDEQNKREGLARSAWTSAELYLKMGQYSSAYELLRQLLDPKSPLHHTDYFDDHEAAIRAAMDQVREKLSNTDLLDDFPATQIDSKEGVTKIWFDFDTPEQLKALVGRAVLEPSPVAAAVTPEMRAGNLRLHIQRGLDDGLTRDWPLSLISPFDPARPMTVEFELFTLNSPFFLAIDVDGLQVGILSADAGSRAYSERFKYPEPVPPLKGERQPPTHDVYGRGRGVAFHAGPDFGDPPSWEWRDESRGRVAEEIASDPKRKKDLATSLFAFEPNERYRVKVVRSGGRLTLSVNDREVLSSVERADWAARGQRSDRDKSIHGGTGLIQILTWTPQALDNLQVSGVVLERFKR